MTRRPSRAGRSRDGLFWNPTGSDGEVQDNPLLRPCPACKSAARQACTRPGRGGRIPLHGFHDSRRDPSERATHPDRQPGEKVNDSKPEDHTVHFASGPWHGKSISVDHVTAPVFAVGHEIGNHYWLDLKSDPPRYHWDGTPWTAETPEATR